jgi:tetratricopeptide (TPR) repeat protein
MLAKGISYYQRGCYDRSHDTLLRAFEMYTATDDRAGAASALNNLGNVYRARKDLPRSLLYYDAAADLFSGIDHTEGQRQALVNRASVLIEAGRLDAAQAALAAARDAGGRDTDPGASWMLAHGILLSRKGAPAPAEDALLQALKKADADMPAAVSGVHYALARLLLDTGRYPAAVEQAEAALSEDRRRGAVGKTADDLILLGTAFEHLGRVSEAAGAFRRAIKIYALLGNREAVAETASRLKAAGADTLHPVTLEFVEQWLKGDLRSDICR